MVKHLIFVLLLVFAAGCSALEDTGRAARARAEAEAERAQAQRLDREALLRSAEAMSMTIAAQATQTARLADEVTESARAWRGLTVVTTVALVAALVAAGLLALAILSAVNGRRSDHARPTTIYVQMPPQPSAPPALPPAARQQMLPEERARQRFLRLQQGQEGDRP